MSAPAGSWRSPPPPGSGAPLTPGCADIARTRPCRFRRHDLVFAVGTGRAFSRHCRERQPRGCRGLGGPQVKRQIEQDAIEVTAMSPNEVTRFMQSEIDRWTPMITRLVGAK